VAKGGDPAILFCFVFSYLVFAGGRPLSIDRIAPASRRIGVAD
jgi:hypothetical protein